MIEQAAAHAEKMATDLAYKLEEKLRERAQNHSAQVVGSVLGGMRAALLSGCAAINSKDDGECEVWLRGTFDAFDGDPAWRVIVADALLIGLIRSIAALSSALREKGNQN